MKKNNWLSGCCLALVCLLFGPGCRDEFSTKGKKILVFSKTEGFRHESIPAGIQALQQMGAVNGFEADTTENAAFFSFDTLFDYDAVVFLNTSGDVLNADQQDALEQYIKSGGGYVGIHAATDTEYDWPWYNKLVGAYFNGHPHIQEATAAPADRHHISMTGFPDTWEMRDEFYNFKSFYPKVNVLVNLNEASYEGGNMGDRHPMSWYHEFDGGRAFYTGFGHTAERYADTVFLQHLLGGLKYAMSGKRDSTRARPDKERFTKELLVDKLDEPMELAVLDEYRVLLSERGGKVKLFDRRTGLLKVVGEIPVYHAMEYGLVGLSIDPRFNDNKWVYLFYSPASGAADTLQHLSRFKYDDRNDTLLLNTEEVILTFPVKRNNCCHTGGSIAWDAAGNLYLSTGDDVHPGFSDGYTPIDETPVTEPHGKIGVNAQATSANTSDLRGKILRIKPRYDIDEPAKAGGTRMYDIPEGNLFPPGSQDEKARPEIYVMGNRNPYRIDVDKRTGFLYWGEVGPDAGHDDSLRGPRGYDEVNQARRAGNFGWPYFIADNKAYSDYDFVARTHGEKFHPDSPVNNDPANTGLASLPPAQPAFIWYPYAASREFGPAVGSGGRTAMAGPVYYYDDYKKSADKFPPYYNRKLFVYEWIRDYINVVTMDNSGDLLHIERFMPGTAFSHPVDMQFAPDGSLYVLEYGPNWAVQNDEASLSRITFNGGNLPPVAKATAVDAVGALPLTVKFSAAGSSDFEGEDLHFEWNFGDGKSKAAQSDAVFTYTEEGEYTATLKVTDQAGNSGFATVGVKAGNSIPEIDISTKNNRSFYWEGAPVLYDVKVKDHEDGSLEAGTIAGDEVAFSIHYLEGHDKVIAALGHQEMSGDATGKRLIERSDCGSCHSIVKTSIGPSFTAIAEKYFKENRIRTIKKLSAKILDGGGGVWGTQAMSAHPDLPKKDAEQMVQYILSLGNERQRNRQPLSGTFLPSAKKKENRKNTGAYIFTASYTDKGHGNIGPLTGMKKTVLRSPVLSAAEADEEKGIRKYRDSLGMELVEGLADGSYIAFNDIDVSGIDRMIVSTGGELGRSAGGVLEVRSNTPTGPLIGHATAKPNGVVLVPLRRLPDHTTQKLMLVFRNPASGGRPLFSINEIRFER